MCALLKDSSRPILSDQSEKDRILLIFPSVSAAVVDVVAVGWLGELVFVVVVVVAFGYFCCCRIDQKTYLKLWPQFRLNRNLYWRRNRDLNWTKVRNLLLKNYCSSSLVGFQWKLVW